MKLNGRVIIKMKQKVLRDIDMISPDEVLPRLEVLYTNNPRDVEVLKALTHIYYNKKDYAKAFRFVLNALEVSPNDAQALKYKAWIYGETGDQRNYTETLEQIIQAGKADWEVYDQYAELNENNGNYPRALGYYTLALKDPNNIQPHHAAIGGANCYSKSGAYGIADEIYDTLLSAYPENLPLLHNKANNYYLKGELNKAEKILQGIIINDPQFEISNLLLEDIKKKRSVKELVENGKEEDIKKELKSFVDFNGNLIFTQEELNESLQNAKDLQIKGDYEGAKNILTTILKNDNSIAAAWFCLAELYYELLEILEAIVCCDEALSLLADMNDSRSIATLFLKAQSLYSLGKLDEALAIVDDITSKDPSDYISILIKARILNRKGDYLGTLNILLPLLRILPPGKEITAFAHYILATAYCKLGNKPKFMEELGKSVRGGCEFGTRWFRVRFPQTVVK